MCHVCVRQKVVVVVLLCCCVSCVRASLWQKQKVVAVVLLCVMYACVTVAEAEGCCCVAVCHVRVRQKVAVLLLQCVL